MSGCPAADERRQPGVHVAGATRRRCRGRGARRRGRRRRPPGAPSGSPSTGTMPTPCLPVDSAMSCSSQAPRDARSGSMTKVSLSRPARARAAMAAPSTRAGLSSRVGARQVGHDAGVLEERVDVQAAAGPPARGRRRSGRCSGRPHRRGLRNVSRNLSECGMASRAPPGSETETKPSPALSLREATHAVRPRRSQRWARKASVSVVVPDLVATMRRVRCGSSAASRAATASGWVESSTWSVRPLSDSG